MNQKKVSPRLAKQVSFKINEKSEEYSLTQTPDQKEREADIEPDLNLSFCKRTTLPPTANAKVDKVKLKQYLAKASFELEKNITSGNMPVFGYPLVCFSPAEDDV